MSSLHAVIYTKSYLDPVKALRYRLYIVAGTGLGVFGLE